MYEIIDGTWLSPKGKPVTFRYRSDTNDFNSLSSTLSPHDEYRTAEVSPKVALDIGGYLGSVGISIAVDNPEARVLIVEPVPWNVSLIWDNIVFNHVSERVTVFSGAVGPPGVSLSEIRYGYRGDPSLEHHAFVGNTSLAYDDGGAAEHDAIQVETLGIADLLDRYELAPDWTKIDCEGAEWAFFDAPLIDLRRLPYIIGEVHPVRGHAMTDLAGLLATHRVTLDGPAAGPCGFTAVLR